MIGIGLVLLPALPAQESRRATSNPAYTLQEVQRLAATKPPGPQVLDRLVQMITAKDPAVRMAAASALTRFAQQALPARPELRRLLDHKGPGVRPTALLVLSQLEGAFAHSVAGLAHRVRTGDPTVFSELQLEWTQRYRALPQELIDSLVERLATSSQPIQILRTAPLGSASPGAALARLVQDPKLRLASLRPILQLLARRPQGAAGVANRLVQIARQDPQLRQPALAALTAISSLNADAATGFAALLTDPDEEIVRAALTAAAKLTNHLGTLIPQLRRLLRDPLFVLPVYQLIQTNPDPLAGLAKALSALLAGNQPPQRVAAVRALGAIGAPASDAIPALLQLLGNQPDNQLRTAILAALGGIGRGSPEVTSTFLAQLGHSDPTVQQAAVANGTTLGLGDGFNEACAKLRATAGVKLRELLDHRSALAKRPLQHTRLSKSLSNRSPFIRLLATHTLANNPKLAARLAGHVALVQRNASPRLRHAQRRCLAVLRRQGIELDPRTRQRIQRRATHLANRAVASHAAQPQAASPNHNYRQLLVMLASRQTFERTAALRATHTLLNKPRWQKDAKLRHLIEACLDHDERSVQFAAGDVLRRIYRTQRKALQDRWLRGDRRTRLRAALHLDETTPPPAFVLALAMADPNAWMRRQATHLAMKTAPMGATQLTVARRALADSTAEVRAVVLQHLARHGQAVAPLRPALEKALPSLPPHQRQTLAHQIVQLGEGWQHLLGQLLKRDDTWSRSNMVLALRGHSIDIPDIQQPLLRLADHPHTFRAAAALRVLGENAERVDASRRASIVASFRKNLQRLIPNRQHGNFDVLIGLTALGKAGGFAVPVLLKHPLVTESFGTEQLLDALQACGATDTQLADRCLRALSGPPRTRQGAVRYLAHGTCVDDRLVEALLPTLRDARQRDRQHQLAALARMLPQASPAARRKVGQTLLVATTQRSLIYSILGQPSMSKIVASLDATNRDQLWQALRNPANEHLLRLLPGLVAANPTLAWQQRKKMQGRGRTALFTALAQLETPPPAFASELLRGFDNPKPNHQEQARLHRLAPIVGGLGDSSLPFLLRSLKAMPQPHNPLLVALQHQGPNGAAAIPVLLQRLRRLPAGSTDWRRARYLQLLSVMGSKGVAALETLRLPNQELLPLLAAAVRRSDPSARMAALRAMLSAELAPSRIAHGMQTMLRSKHASERRFARRALPILVSRSKPGHNLQTILLQTLDGDADLVQQSLKAMRRDSTLASFYLPHVVQLLAHPSAATRQTALRTLATWQQVLAPAKVAIQETTSDADAEVQRLAKELLQQLR